MVSIILFGLFNTPHLKNESLPRTNLEQKPLQDSTCICKLDCETSGKGKGLTKRICGLCLPSIYKRQRVKPHSKQNGRETYKGTYKCVQNKHMYFPDVNEFTHGLNFQKIKEESRRRSKREGGREEIRRKEVKKEGRQVEGDRDHSHKFTGPKSYCSLESMVLPRETFQNETLI